MALDSALFRQWGTTGKYHFGVGVINKEENSIVGRHYSTGIVEERSEKC